MNRREFISFILPAGFCTSNVLAGDLFSELDAELEAQFSDIDSLLEEQFLIVDQAMEQAYQELSVAVGKKWGKDDIELPTKKKWVDYSEKLDARRQFDFDKGELVVEKLVESSRSEHEIVEDMKQMVDQAVADTNATLSEKDIALKRASEIVINKGISLPLGIADSSSANDSVIKNLVQKKAVTNISLKDISKTKSVDGKLKVTLKIPFKKGYHSKLAEKYLDPVVRYSKRQGVPPSLVLAVMQTESAFNPRATSHIPAYGLMQLVPRSGGMDAYRFVYGEKRLLGPDYLYTPEKNIELGVSYLDLVNSRYLKPIVNDESRWLCTIAAYNTGAGNVSKSFGGRNAKQVASKINAMTPDAIFDHLVSKLPYEETQRYVVKVTKARKTYKYLDDYQG